MSLGLPTYFKNVDVADLGPLSVLIKTGDQPATLRILGDDVIMNADDTGDQTVTVEGPPMRYLISSPGPPPTLPPSPSMATKTSSTACTHLPSGARWAQPPDTGYGYPRQDPVTGRGRFSGPTPT